MFFRYQSWWHFKSIQLRQSTKQVKARRAEALPTIFTLCLFQSLHPIMLFCLQPCAKGKIARRIRFVKTPARESTTAHVHQASMATSVKVLYTRPHWCLLQLGRYRADWGIWRGAVLSHRNLDLCLEEAAVMMDYCNYQNWHGLALFTTGTGCLILWIIVL